MYTLKNDLNIINIEEVLQDPKNLFQSQKNYERVKKTIHKNKRLKAKPKQHN
ncbi:hypothetical protein CWI38_0150p0010 [Hamiltosporidium tvaerminnensis]|uniref:Uncharacterized protein n=1 Tax=Hamiltosporidium tvaerminnensis TaxID=1176355 RepID=A0A4Q9M072_9MICR|nr:hypothetical protein CWI38_0150p0010 [Hamiltosporidium tvaerminnensis]